MWKRFIVSTFGLLCFLGLAGQVTGQEKIRTATLSPRFTGIAGTPKLALNGDLRSWVAAWRQPGPPDQIVARSIPPDGPPGPVHSLANGIAAFEDAFDIVYTPHSRSYWLAYETDDGLRLRRFSQGLIPQGATIAIESGVHQTQPRMVFDRTRDRLLLFWLSSAGHSLRLNTRGSDGVSVAGNHTIYNAPPGSRLALLNTALNARNGLVICLLLRQDATSTELLAVRINGAGTVLPVTSIMKFAGAVSVDASAAFSSASGQGLAVWASAGNPLRRGLLKADGSLLNSALDLADESGSTSTSVYFDTRNNRFVSVWARQDEIRIAAFHPQSAAVTLQPSTLARSISGAATHVATSFEPVQGRAIAAWDDRNGAACIVRSSTFQIRAGEIVVKGRVSLKKVYDPPLNVNGVPYLIKYHVWNGARLYRAYVTPETHFIGRKPDEGDWILMNYEPARSRFRGYIEEIRVIPPPGS